MEPKITIIIPCKEIDFYTEKCISRCLDLDYENFEIFVLPDFMPKMKKFPNSKRLKIIETGKVKPAVKRNIAKEKSTGELLASIDSDAYPRKDWLRNAAKYFSDKRIGLVGGPNLTPAESNFYEKVSGYVLSNYFAAGRGNIRYKTAKNQTVNELPSCNYISRKSVSPDYKTNFLTAEDSKFCFDISAQGYKLLYAGDVIVYHHRRDSIKKHLKQMFIYGRDIAWLIKDNFSLDKLYYSMPSLFTLGILAGIIASFFSQILRAVFLMLLLIYFFIIFVTSIHKNVKTTFFVFFTTIFTHIYYGIGFLYALFVKNKEGIAVR